MCFNLTVAISIRVGPATSTALNTLVGVKREDRSEIEEDMLWYETTSKDVGEWWPRCGQVPKVLLSRPQQVIVGLLAEGSGPTDRPGVVYQSSHKRSHRLPPFPTPRGPTAAHVSVSPCWDSFCEQKSDHMLPEVRYVTRLSALCKISPVMKITFSCCI